MTPAGPLGSIVPNATAAAAPENLQMLDIVAVTAVVCESAAEAEFKIETKASAVTSASFFMMSLKVKLSKKVKKK